MANATNPTEGFVAPNAGYRLCGITVCANLSVLLGDNYYLNLPVENIFFLQYRGPPKKIS